MEAMKEQAKEDFWRIQELAEGRIDLNAGSDNS
jgi:hypothetical protein